MPGETLVESTTRGTKNAFTSFFGCIKKSDEIAKIKYKESQIVTRERAFGVEYMKLLAKGATPEELDACVKEAQADTKKITDEIAELEKEIARVDEETNKKIITKPSAIPAKPAETKTDTPGTTTAPVEEAPAAPAADPTPAAPAADPTPAAPAADPTPAPAPVETPPS
jgi:hypothetical protein